MPLNRAQVLHEAVALADADGMDAVSMRALSQRLNVVPMALYRHVADKEDLLDGMVDAVIEEFTRHTSSRDPETSTQDWRHQIRTAALGARDVVRRHPWARRAIETRTVRTPTVLAHMERLSAMFIQAGFSPDLTHHAMHTLGNRIWGFSPELFNDPAQASTGKRKPPRHDTPPDPTDYPAIMAISADAVARRGDQGCDEDFEFGFALDLILDGLDRLRSAGWRSRQPEPAMPDSQDEHTPHGDPG